MLRNLRVDGRLVSFDGDALEALRRHVMERFLAAEPVGEETIGILYGTDEGSLQVSAWRAISRETPSAPAVPLAAADETALRSLVEDTAGGARAIGVFRSRTRGMAALSPEDLAACRKLFGERECLSLILRPSTQRPVAASFRLVAPGEEAESSQRGVRVSLRAPASAAAPVAMKIDEATPAEAAPVVEAAAASLPLAARRRWLKPAVAFAAGVAISIAAIVFYLDRPLRLKVTLDGPRLTVEWNGAAGLVTRAKSATLRVGRTIVPLSQSQLRQGRWTGTAPSSDFPVSLHLHGGVGGPRWAGTTVIRDAWARE
jgi:hypothetical protein